MDVYSVPWQDTMTVQWENVKCDKGLADDMVMATDEVSTKPSRIHLSVPLLRDLPEARVGIVELGEEEVAADQETTRKRPGSPMRNNLHILEERAVQ